MKRLSIFVLAAVLLLAETVLSQKSATANYGEFLVSFQTNSSQGQRQQFLDSYNLEKVNSYKLLPNVVLVREKSVQIRRHATDIEMTSMTQRIANMQRDSNVRYVEPNYVVQADDFFPNDPKFDQLWGLHNTGQTGGVADADIDAPEAWGVFSARDTVIIGVIDTGIDYEHEDLAGVMWRNPGEIPNNGVDDDGNKYIDDVYGYNFAYGDNDPMDDEGHGTHCAGTIGAVINNGTGVAGVCPTVKLMALKFLDYDGYGYTSDAISAIEYAIENGAHLTSNSWGGTGASQAMYEAIQAANEVNQLFIAAAGNDGADVDYWPHYPSCYDLPNIISVAASTDEDEFSGFSNYGVESVDLAAPGSNIWSTYYRNGYQSLSGTSMATPHVAGVAGLLYSNSPGSSNLEIKDWILASVDTIETFVGQMVSSGRLNAYKALILAEPDSIPPAAVLDLTVTTVTSNWAELQWTATGDDGDSGRASFYEIRYATLPITAENFNSATPAINTPQPEEAGQIENFRVFGLDFNTTYYFALRVLDEKKNSSLLSNVVTGTTLGVPALSYTPDSLYQELASAEQAQQFVTLTNSGEGTLDFTLPGFAALDVLASTTRRNEPPDASEANRHVEKNATDDRQGRPVVLGAGGPDAYGYVWIDSNEPGGPAFNWLDITTLGTPLSLRDDDQKEIALPFIFPFYGEYFSSIKISSNGFITFGDAAVSPVNDIIPNPAVPNGFIAPLWDDLNPDINNALIYYYHDPQAHLFIVQYQEFMHYHSYYYHGANTFQLILNRRGDILFQYLEIEQDVLSPTVGIESPDGTDGLLTAFNTYYAEEGLAVSYSLPSRWLSISPTNGTLYSGERAELEFHFDASGLEAGQYQNNVSLVSNDPVHASVSLPAVLSVTQAADIYISTEMLDFGVVFLGGSRQLPLEIINEGYDDLEITNIYAGNTDFQPQRTAFTIAPRQVDTLYVSFNATVLGVFADSLTIVSNDPAQPLYKIALFGHAATPPVAALSPTALSAQLLTGGLSPHVLSLSNRDGGSDLDYDILFHKIESPGLRSVLKTVDITIPASEQEKPAAGENITQPFIRPTPEKTITVPFGLTSARLFTKVLLLTPDENISDLYASLVPFEDLTVSIFPYQLLHELSLDDLTPYDVVLTTNNHDWYYGYSDPVHIGNVLADYVDIGGRVVMGNYACLENEQGLRGRFMDEGYAPFEPSFQLVDHSATLGEIYLPEHPIVTDVSEVFSTYYRINTIPAQNAERIADWDDGIVFIAATSRVVGINLLASDGYGAPGWAGHVPTLLHNAIIWLSTGTSTWLTYEPAHGTVAAGTSQAIDVLFNANRLKGGDYKAELNIRTNDPLHETLTVSIDLQVTAAPDIVVSCDSLLFQPTFVGGTTMDTLLISNYGTSTLNISNIDAPTVQFFALPTSFSLAPGASQYVTVYFSPHSAERFMDYLVIQSNDHDEPALTVYLEGTGLVPPDLIISPDSLSHQVFSGKMLQDTLLLENLGGADLIWAAQASKAEESAVLVTSGPIDGVTETDPKVKLRRPASKERRSEHLIRQTVPTNPGTRQVDKNELPSLETVLERLEFNHEKITNIIPHRFDFEGGETGYYIYDGGHNMYDDGNFLNTYYEWYFDYSNKQIRSTYYFGDQGRYFTAKYPGLFVLAADADQVYYFGTDGYIGGYERGQVDGSILTTKVDNVTYTGFVKRVYHKSSPSVNHLVIIPETPGAYQEFSGYTYYDEHWIDGIRDVDRLYYLLFAGDDAVENGFYIDDDAMLAIMNKFLEQVHGVASWLSITPTEGTLPGGSQQDVLIDINTIDLDAGEHNAVISVTSNDPTNGNPLIPVSVNVIGAPDISVSPASLDFGEHFIHSFTTDTLFVTNTGTDTLLFYSVAYDTTHFRVNSPVSFLPPKTADTLFVTFAPQVEGDLQTNLVISTNDPDEASLSVLLSGRGQLPPVIAVQPDSIYMSLVTGAEESVDLTISNADGQSELDWFMQFAYTEESQVVSSSPIFDQESGRKEKSTPQDSPQKIDRQRIYTFPPRAKANSAPTHSTSSTKELEEILAALDDNYAEITNTIPHRFDFSGGESSYYIYDGGYYMYYLRGNYLNTDLFRSIYYSNGNISTGSQFGDGSRYFTRKYPGLFLLAVDHMDISEFYITGSLGGYYGQVDGTVLQTTLGGQSYYGFVKRVSHGGAPSVNHLFIVEANDEVNQEFSMYADEDYHRLFNLENCDRFYYALFAGDINVDDGYYYDDDTVLNIMNSILTAMRLSPPWISCDVTSGSIAAGAEMTVPITFDAAILDGGDYFADINISSNDPTTPVLTVPTRLDVTSAPHMVVEPDSINFGGQFVNSQSQALVRVKNTGSDSLLVSTVSSTNENFIVSQPPFAVAPKQEHQLTITYAPTTAEAHSGSIELSSNDVDVRISVEGIGLVPPDIAVQPDSFHVVLNSGESRTETLEISNLSGSLLEWIIDVNYLQDASLLVVSEQHHTTDKDAVQKDRSRGRDHKPPENHLKPQKVVKDSSQVSFSSYEDNLPDLLSVKENLDESYEKIINAIPYRFNFEGGDEGVEICDYYMYDCGNWIDTDYDMVEYTNGAISQNGEFGNNGQYFTAKYPGLFVLAADMDDAFGFYINGWLWHYDSWVDAAVFEMTVDDVPYYGFVKRMFAGPSPSINHIIITPALPDIWHEYSYWGEEEYHAIFGLDECPRLYYLLYAGDVTQNGGYYIDNDATMNIMATFLNAVKPTHKWLTVTPDSGSTEAGSTSNVSAVFDTGEMLGGDYSASISVHNNDPDNNRVDIPTRLTVVGIPRIALSRQFVQFDSLFVGNTQSDTLTIRNIGTDVLNISGLSIDSPDFGVDPAPFTIGPKEDHILLLHMNPTQAGDLSGTLTIQCNDAENAEKTVALTGCGLEPPHICVEPDSFLVNLRLDETKERLLTIGNCGSNVLEWSISLAAADTSLVLSTSPNFSSPHSTFIKKQNVPPLDKSKRYTFDRPVFGTNNTTAALPTAPLEKILAKVNENITNVSNAILNRYDFEGGYSGFYISDGGDDMYDGGNYLYTNLYETIYYSDNFIQTSQIFGDGGRYFTKKVDGLFMLAADMNGIEEFVIDGDLGADGAGYVNGAILSTTVGGRNYFGFVKRVFGGYDPSVNHLVIIEQDPQASHEFYTDTNYDYHRVFGLSAVKRLYYLLWAGDPNINDGYEYDDQTTLGIMNAFLSAIDILPPWIRIEPMAGQVAAGDQQQVLVTFDATEISGGHYFADVQITSNDPANTIQPVPAHCFVELTSFQYTLQPSWNLIGLPLDIPHQDYHELFVKAKKNSLLGWNGEYTDEKIMQPGHGYWLIYPQVDTLQFFGPPVDSLSIRITPGWNLISGPIDPLPVHAIQDPDSILPNGSIFGFDGVYVKADTLKPGFGYWVRAEKAGTLILLSTELPDSSLAKQKAPLASIPQKYIEFTNGTGKKQQLYFDAQMENQSQTPSEFFPPVPLHELFDVRFEENQRAIAEFDEIDILLQGIEYPVTLAAFNLSDEDEYDYVITSSQDAKISFKLQDKASFILNNPRVNTLQLSRFAKIPEFYALEQNYPNPFNPSTTIKYALPEDTFVDVFIFNTLGQRIRTLVSKDQKAGRYDIIWDGKDHGGRLVGSGVYYVLIKTENFKASKKMVFLK